MYTLDSPILYSEAARGEHIPGQHTNCFHILLAVLSKRCANRFLLWWLYLHRRLRSRQRGSQLSLMSDFAPFGCSFPNGVARFYPNNSD